MLDTTRTLAEISVRRPAATRVFWRHQLDFCCGGQRTLAEACESAGLDAGAVVTEIEREETGAAAPEARWVDAPLDELVAFIVERYHEALRRSLPVLVQLAQKVEARHADKPTCPRGLASLLQQVTAAVEGHLGKEEQVLFPMIAAGHGRRAHMPVRVMLQEHDDHGASLRRIRELTGDLVTPPEACNSWRALYDGLLELERELMEHIHLENNVLFPRALAEG
jgi:regulator of cell morphogenesis and NO signaling